MATDRSARKYPLQLKSAASYPLNAGLVTAYDYAGDPANAYAGGDGAPHVGTWSMTKDTGAAFPVVTVSPGILGRDLSQGMRTDVRQAYRRIYADKIGIGSADGKGPFTLHFRLRTPAVFTGTTGVRTLYNMFDGSGAKIRIIMAESASGYLYLAWELSASSSTATNIPSTSARFTDASLRIPHNSVVDIYLTRDGDLFSYYINGALAATLTNADYVLNSAAWSGNVSGQYGVTGTTPADIVAIDNNYWNRALSAGEVQAHAADPYGGYVPEAVEPVATPPAAPTGLIASGGVNQMSVSGTPGSDGGAPVFEYVARVYKASDNALVTSKTGATLPIVVTGLVAQSVYAKLVARNSVDDSPESAASNTVAITDPVVVEPPPPPPSTPIRYDFPAAYAIFAPATEPPSSITSVTISPRSVSLDGGGVRQFTATVVGDSGANTAVDWTCSKGTVNLFGTYTAPDATDSDQQVTVRATSTQDPTKWGEATVIVNARVVDEVESVTVSPATVTAAGGSQQQFTAQVNGPADPSQDVAWVTSAGVISATGVLTLPQAATFEQTIVVRATSMLDPRKYGEATAKILGIPVDEVQTVTVTPAVANVNGGESVQFAAEVSGPNGPSQEVTWTTTLGTIDAEGVVVVPEAGPREQAGTVTATSVQDPTKKGTALFVVAAGMTSAFVPSTSRQVRILPGRLAFAVGSHWTLGAAGPVGTKDPNSSIDIPFDWSEWLADIGKPGLAKIEFLLGGGLVSDGVVPNARGGTVVVSGGSLQQTGTVTCRITTDTTPPRTEDRTVVLQMREQ